MGNSGYVILSILRQGKCHASRKMISILKFLLKRIRHHFPKTNIKFRADAGFGIPRLYEYLEVESIDYAIGLMTNTVLLKSNREHQLDRSS